MTMTPDPGLVSLAAGLVDSADAEPALSVPTAVLIVDDQPRMRESLGALLSGRGFEVELADSGAAALERMERPPVPDLILLDMVMPGTSGLEVIAALAARDLDTRIVVLSGEPSFEHVQRALTQGAADFLRKPFESEELFSTLARVERGLDLERRARVAEKRLTESERLHRFMIDHAPDMVYLLDPEGCFTFVNDRASALLGWPREALLGRHYTTVVHEQDFELARFVFNERRTGDRASRDVELRLRSRLPAQGGGGQGEVVAEITATGIYAAGGSDTRGDFLGTYGLARDVTERKRAQEMVQYQAYHDLLTHLPNRALFNDRLELAVTQARRKEGRLAVMFLDLDRFKVVNDTLGHTVGDRLLKQVAERLRNCLRGGDTLARLGGDEFCFLLPDVGCQEDAAGVAQKVLDRLSTPFQVEDHELFVGASIGISVYPDSGASVEALIQSADIAMYHIKGRGKNGYAFFLPDMNAKFCSLLALERELRNALANDDLEPFFQPQVDLHTGAIIGVEALARWHHPERGVVEPIDFIPMAEETGLILQVDRCIQRKACEAVAAWQRGGHAELSLSLNVSAAQMEQADFVERMLAMFEETGVSIDSIRLEITESVIMREMEVILPKLRRLRSNGVRIGIDDFGTGYSSLSYLQRFPVDTLKIDRSFVCDIRGDGGDASLVNAIIHMARGLGLDIVAEGVENSLQLRYLQQQGCHQVQGYIFSRPVDRSGFEICLAEGVTLADPEEESSTLRSASRLRGPA
ncbi:MAG: EAL domain-containing protein [Gammaproteobacteria bacterium]|nr:EAL domain-containing protein [Gammaproteobacteria bacterium]